MSQKTPLKWENVKDFSDMFCIFKDWKRNRAKKILGFSPNFFEKICVNENNLNDILPVGFDVVDERVFVSGLPVATEQLRNLKKIFNVEIVVTCTLSPLMNECQRFLYLNPHSDYIVDLSIEFDEEMEFMHIPLKDSRESIPNYFEFLEIVKMFDRISASSKNVLFHCFAGSVRSYFIAFMYIKYREFKKGLKVDLKKREGPKCNVGVNQYTLLDNVFIDKNENIKQIFEGEKIKKILKNCNEGLRERLKIFGNKVHPYKWLKVKEISVKNNKLVMTEKDDINYDNLEKSFNLILEKIVKFKLASEYDYGSETNFFSYDAKSFDKVYFEDFFKYIRYGNIDISREIEKSRYSDLEKLVFLRKLYEVENEEIKNSSEFEIVKKKIFFLAKKISKEKINSKKKCCTIT